MARRDAHARTGVPGDRAGQAGGGSGDAPPGDAPAPAGPSAEESPAAGSRAAGSRRRPGWRRTNWRTALSGATFVLSVAVAALGGMWLAQRADGDSPGAQVADAAAEPEVVPRLATVPGTPGLRVRVNGTVMVTGDDGTVPLPGGLSDVDVEVLDVEGGPEDEQVTFSSWSDGEGGARRTIAVTGEELPRIGLQRSHQVHVFAGPGYYQFTPSVEPEGALLLSPGVPTWVPVERTVVTASGFEALAVGYTLTAAQFAAAGTTTPDIGATYESAPGAVWEVTVLAPS